MINKHFLNEYKLIVKHENKLINQVRCTKLDISRLYYVLKITTFVSFKNVTIPSHGTRDFKPLFFTENLSQDDKYPLPCEGASLSIKNTKIQH